MTSTIETGLSAARTKAGRLQRALLERLNVHERQKRQRDQVAARLAELTNGDGDE